MKSAAFNTSPVRPPLLNAATTALALLPLLSATIAWRSAYGMLYGRWYWGYLAGMTALRWTAVAGLWKLRRWGAYLAWASLALDGAFGWFLGEATWLGALIPVGLGLLIAIDFGELRHGVGQHPRNSAE